MPLTDKRNDYKIRIARKSDADEIYYLVQRAFSSYSDKGTNPVQDETIDDIVFDLNHNIVLVIEHLGFISGSLRLCTLENNNFYLKRFSVHPFYQNLGMGTSLYYYAEDFVKKRDGRNIYLYSSLEDERLISFYEKLGFLCLDLDYKNGYKRGYWGKKISGVDIR